MKVLVDVKRIEGGIKSTVAGTETEAALGFCHQGVEIGDIGSIKGQCQFGQDELAPVGDLGSNDAGGIYFCGQFSLDEVCGLVEQVL